MIFPYIMITWLCGCFAMRFRERRFLEDFVLYELMWKLEFCSLLILCILFGSKL